MKNEKKKSTKKLSGFYIALCCCVLVIGIAGYFTEKQTERAKTVINNEFTEEHAVATAIPRETIVPAPTAAPSPTLAPSPTMPPVEKEAYALDNPDIEDGAITVSSEQPAFIMPLSGEVLEQYSDIPHYNSALGDYRTHGGVDFAAEKGCSVAAAAQGVVEKVYENAMGKCVELSHAGGFVTRYMGLDTVENLTEGKEVQSGEVIATSGECKGENVTQPHLHFEMTKDGVAVNPSDFLPH